MDSEFNGPFHGPDPLSVHVVQWLRSVRFSLDTRHNLIELCLIMLHVGFRDPCTTTVCKIISIPSWKDTIHDKYWIFFFTDPVMGILDDFARIFFGIGSQCFDGRAFVAQLFQSEQCHQRQTSKDTRHSKAVTCQRSLKLLEKQEENNLGGLQ